MEPRGTRPKTGQPWPRNQEQRRKETAEHGQKIADLARKAQDTTNMQMREVYLARIEALGERIARLMTEAKLGTDEDEQP